MCGRFQLASDEDIAEINKIIAEVQANISRNNVPLLRLSHTVPPYNA